MSADTPEADEASFDYDAQCEYWVASEFARKLERERDYYKRSDEDWERWIKEVLADFRIPHDPHTIGMRTALTYWMVEMNEFKQTEQL
jgi:hypothetical protein